MASMSSAWKRARALASPPEAVGEDRRPEALGPQEPLRRPEEVEVCPHEAEGKPP